MDKEFNSMRSKKTSPQEQVLTKSKDPFQRGSRPAVAPQRVVRSQEAPVKQAASSLGAAKVSEKETKVDETSRVEQKPAAYKAAKNRRTKNLPWKWIVIGVVAAAAIAVGVFFLVKAISGGDQSNGNDPQGEISVEEAYPIETATSIDVAIAKEIKLVEAGHYMLSGDTTVPIVVDAPGDVVIYLNGISVSAPETPALSNLSGKPLTLILMEGTTSNFQTDNTAKDAIYSTGDLIIKGKGDLNAVGIDVAEGREFRKEAKVNDMRVKRTAKEQPQEQPQEQAQE